MFRSLFILCCLAGAARAQVNAELLSSAPPRAGWSGGVDAKLTVFHGNTDLVDVGGAARLQHQTLFATDAIVNGDKLPPYLRQRFFVTGSGRFAETLDHPFVSEAFAHARWTAMWQRRVGTDLFLQYQYDQFLRIRVRAIAGTGIRVDMVHRRRFMLWGGSGYLFEYNVVDVAPGARDAPQDFFHRWTSYVSARVSCFEDRLLLQNTIYYQPRFDAVSDFRFLEAFEALTKVSEHFAMGSVLSVLYNSAPPTAVVSTDARLTAFVRLGW